MDSDHLNRWLSVGANVGVLAGIVFLALELQQNNQLLAEESRFGQVQGRIEFNRDVALNPEYASLYYKTSDPAEIEMHRRFAVTRRTLLMWQWEFESIWWNTQESPETITGHWRHIYKNFGYAEVWEKERVFFSPAFAQYMDENVVNQ